MGTVRRHVVIHRPAAEVWELIGDPTALAHWWPGIDSATVDGMSRVVVTGAGLPFPEQIVTNDPLLHRFQYKITAPMFRHHLSTLDVFEIDDGSCLVAYGVDAEPNVLALAIGGAAGNALKNLKQMIESSSSERGDQRAVEHRHGEV